MSSSCLEPERVTPWARPGDRSRAGPWDTALRIGALACLAADAVGETTVSAGVNQRFEYDTRPRLTVFNTDPLSGYVIEPVAGVAFEGSRWALTSDARLVFPFYDRSAFNIDEQHLSVDAALKGERGRFDVAADYDRDSTLTAEIINDVQEVQASRREAAYLRPQWTRQLTVRDQIVLGGSALNVNFDGRGFVDYEQQSADATWQRTLNALTSVQTSVAYSQFTADPLAGFDPFVGPLTVQRDNETLALNVGLTRVFSPTLTGSVQIGYQIVDTTITTTPALFPELASSTSEESTGSIYAATLEYSGERTQLEGSASRSVSPSVVGQLLARNEFSLSYRRRLGRRATFILSGALVERDTIGSGEPPPGLQQQVFRIEPRLRWQFRERWTLLTGVRYAVVGDPQDVDGTRAFMEFRYAHPDFRPF
jgi:hypothetical protein